MTNFNKLFGVPEGHEYQTSTTYEAWQKVTVTFILAKCKKTGKQITRRVLPQVTDWEEVRTAKNHKMRSKS